MAEPVWECSNSAYHLRVSLLGEQVGVRLHDVAVGVDIADAPYVYRASRPTGDGLAVSERLQAVAVQVRGGRLTVSGTLAGLELTHELDLPSDRPLLEEWISLRNSGSDVVELRQLACGFQRRVTNAVAAVLAQVQHDRIAAMPFRHRATDPTGWDNEFDVAGLLSRSGRELRVNELAPLEHGYVPSDQWLSEGWAWSQGAHTLAIMKFSQEAMEFSSLAVEVDEAGVCLRFGGVGMPGGEPSALCRIHPGQAITLGTTRMVTVKGGYERACYALRAYLDEMGCRLPPDFDPPVHWNELYDNPEWHVATPGQTPPPRASRALTYTREMLLREAAKAAAYGCEALYLDPGWDTAFGTFLWGEEWLGDRRAFIGELRERFGLRTSLHCPLATWTSFQGPGVASWPVAAQQMDEQGRLITRQGWSGVEAPGLCLGSRQYLDEAERRLLVLCADGVAYLMFDGNWWNGGCWNPEHGHPVPYTFEDHCRANLELARRVHRRYPGVIIEMHDMITGGSAMRYTPVYYKYGLPGSYDENWGFELMWQPMEDILSGRARALYYYNLGCSVPAYLHVDLRSDNEHCLVLWWYASTCRHLGIGGTHEDPHIAQAHRQAMRRYRDLAAYYKRGEFYGLSEAVHIHVLPRENAFVVNLFNLSDESRVIAGTIPLEELGLEREDWYVSPMGGGFDSEAGTFAISRRLPPWSAQVAEVYPLSRLTP